jgi:hypothetical protein
MFQISGAIAPDIGRTEPSAMAARIGSGVYVCAINGLVRHSSPRGAH